MKTITLISLLSFFFHVAFTQDSFIPGYIVKNSGDTVRGYLQGRPEKTQMRQIGFKKSEGTHPDMYKAGEIQSFYYEQGDLYETVSFINTSNGDSVPKTLFARSLVAGFYDLYSIAEDGETHYIVKKDTMTWLLYNDRISNDVLLKGNYFNQLSFFSAGCAVINKNVEHTNYTDGDLSAFIRELDICLAPGAAVKTNYHKPHAKAAFYVFGGGLPLGGKKTQLMADFALRLIYPEIDPKFSLNIALHYSDKEEPATVAGSFFNPGYTVKATHQVFSLPLTLQYNFTSGIIQPYIYIGFSPAFFAEAPESLFPDQHFGIAAIAGVGVEVYVSHRFLVKAEWRHEVITQYPAIGLACKF